MVLGLYWWVDGPLKLWAHPFPVLPTPGTIGAGEPKARGSCGLTCGEVRASSEGLLCTEKHGVLELSVNERYLNYGKEQSSAFETVGGLWEKEKCV